MMQSYASAAKLQGSGPILNRGSRSMQLRFVTSESAFDYFRTTRAYLEQHGKPVGFYSDKHGIFRVNAKDARPRQQRGVAPAPSTADLALQDCPRRARHHLLHGRGHDPV
jgi:hypothetical protein